MKHANNFPTALLAAKLRYHVVDMTHRGKSSHVGSGLSICDILAVLYGRIMKLDSDNPDGMTEIDLFSQKAMQVRLFMRHWLKRDFLKSSC